MCTSLHSGYNLNWLTKLIENCKNTKNISWEKCTFFPRSLCVFCSWQCEYFLICVFYMNRSTHICILFGGVSNVVHDFVRYWKFEFFKKWFFLCLKIFISALPEAPTARITFLETTLNYLSFDVWRVAPAQLWSGALFENRCFCGELIDNSQLFFGNWPLKSEKFGEKKVGFRLRSLLYLNLLHRTPLFWKLH